MKWEGMPRDDVPLSEQKSRKLVYGGRQKVNNIDVIYTGSEMKIFTSYGIYETRCVFYIPSPKARGYKKQNNEFHKYRKGEGK